MDYALKERENQEFFKKQIKEDEELLKQIKKYVVVPYKDWDWKNKTNFKKVEEVNEFLLAQLENKRQVMLILIRQNKDLLVGLSKAHQLIHWSDYYYDEYKRRQKRNN